MEIIGIKCRTDRVEIKDNVLVSVEQIDDAND